MKPSIPLIALALLSCSPAASDGPDISVTNAWARATLPGKPTSAAYFTIANRGGGEDALLAVTTTSGTAEVHSTSMEGGIMRMRKLDRLQVPGGESVALKPGGTHVMLLELAKPLAPGQKIDLTLRFEKSPQQTVAAQVRDSSGDNM